MSIVTAYLESGAAVTNFLNGANSFLPGFFDLLPPFGSTLKHLERRSDYDDNLTVGTRGWYYGFSPCNNSTAGCSGGGSRQGRIAHKLQKLTIYGQMNNHYCPVDGHLELCLRGGLTNPVTNRSMLSLVTLGPRMNQVTPTALETAPTLEPKPLERPTHGPTDVRSNPPQPPACGDGSAGYFC